MKHTPFQIAVAVWAVFLIVALVDTIKATAEPPAPPVTVAESATKTYPEPSPEPEPAPAPTPAPEDTSAQIPNPLPVNETVKVPQGEFTVTAYCSCERCCGYWASVRPLDDAGNPIVYTASGTVAQQGRTIAVDPCVFEYGTGVWLDGPWGVQEFIAEDILGGASGRHIDIYFDDHEEARQWGLQKREVWLYIKEEEIA